MAGNETPKFEIAPYKYSDEQSVGEILGDMYDPVTWEHRWQLIREGNHFERFVCKRINEDGTIGEPLATFRLTREGAGFQVARLAVAQAFQHMGIASQLVDKDIPGIVANATKDSQVQNPPLYLIVDEDNLSARRLYEKFFPDAFKTIVYETRVGDTPPLDIRENIEKREHEALMSRVDIFDELYRHYKSVLETDIENASATTLNISSREFNTMTRSSKLGLQDIATPPDTDARHIFIQHPYSDPEGRHISTMGIIPTCGREGKPAIPLMVRPDDRDDRLVDMCTFYARLPDRIQVFHVHHIPSYPVHLFPDERYERGVQPSPSERRDLKNFAGELRTLEFRLFNKIT